MQTSTVQIAPAKHSRKLVCFNGSVDSVVAVQETLRTNDVDLLIITGPDWGVAGTAKDDPKNVMMLIKALLWSLSEASKFKIQDIFFYHYVEPTIAKHSIQSFSEQRLPDDRAERRQTMRIMTMLQTAAQVVNDHHYATVFSIYTGEKHVAHIGLYSQTFDILRRYRMTFPNVLEFPLADKTGADVIDLLHPVVGVMSVSVSELRGSMLPQLGKFEWERHMARDFPDIKIGSYDEEFQAAISRFSALSAQDKIAHFQSWKGLSYEVVKLRGGDA